MSSRDRFGRRWAAPSLVARPAWIGPTLAPQTPPTESPPNAPSHPQRDSPEVVAAGRPLAEPPEVSAVVTARNRAARLVACLTELEDATRDHDHEIVVVDSCSLDGTSERVATGFPDVRLLRIAPDHGPAWALDAGLAQCGGRTLLLVDAGVHVTAEALEALLGHLAAEPACGAVALPVVDRHGNTRAGAHRFLRAKSLLGDASALGRLWPGNPWRRAHHDPGRPVETTTCGASVRRGVDVLPGGALLMRREVLDVVGGFDAELVSGCFLDDWCLRARQDDWRLDALQEPAVVTGDDAWQPIEADLAVHRDRIRYARKHLGKRGVRCATVSLYGWSALETLAAWFRSDLTLTERWERSRGAALGARRTRDQA